MVTAGRLLREIEEAQLALEVLKLDIRKLRPRQYITSGGPCLAAALKTTRAVQDSLLEIPQK